MEDVGERLPNRVQMTTDGYKPYLDAVKDVFGAAIAYAMLVKVYGRPAQRLSALNRKGGRPG